jgi:hypothetical protein
MKKNININKKGSAIAYGLIMTTVCTIILFAAFQFVVSQLRYSFYLANREQAFQIAETGIQYYHWYLAHETDGKSLPDIKEFWESTSPYPKGFSENPLEEEYKDKKGTAIGKYKVEVTPPASNSSTVEVVSSGWTYKNANIVRKIKVRFRRSAWSDYAILVGAEAALDSVWDVNGKVMGNKGVHFDGVAHNVVSAGVTQYTVPADDKVAPGATKDGVWTKWNNELNTDANPDSQVFLAGKKFPVSQKDFNGIDLGAIKTYAQDEGGTNNCNSKACYFDYSAPDLGRHIILKDHKKFQISTVQKLNTNTNVIKKETSFETFDMPQEGVIYIEGNVWLQENGEEEDEGDIYDSRTTIVAAFMPVVTPYAAVTILNNIEYDKKDGTNVLGVISQGNVDFPSGNNGPDDLKIDAVLLAQNGTINKKNYNTNCCGSGCKDLKNSIDIYGAIISATNPLFSFDKACRVNTDPNKTVGYSKKKVEYDSNLLYFPPPFFPSDSYYLIDLWEES